MGAFFSDQRQGLFTQDKIVLSGREFWKVENIVTVVNRNYTQLDTLTNTQVYRCM